MGIIILQYRTVDWMSLNGNDKRIKKYHNVILFDDHNYDNTVAAQREMYLCAHKEPLAWYRTHFWNQ